MNELPAPRRRFPSSSARSLRWLLAALLLLPALATGCPRKADPAADQSLVAPVTTSASASPEAMASAPPPASPALPDAPASASALPSPAAHDACEDLGVHPASKLPPIPPGQSVRGVDASTPAAWRQLREQGASFAIVQAGLGRTRTAAFGPNWAMAKQCGLPRAAYHFLSPTVDAGQQASLFLAQLGDDRGEIPPIVDVELPPGCKGPCCEVTCEGWSTAVSRWLKDVEQATGHQAMVYTVEEFWKECLCNTSRFALRRLWLAGYPRFDLAPRPGFGGWQRWTFYQYKGNARFGSSALDLDIFNGKAEELTQLFSPPR